MTQCISEMYFFGIGCCTFDGSSFDEKGEMSQEKCLLKCMEDARCVACELKTCVSCVEQTDFHCRIYYTSKPLKDFHTECEHGLSKKCYRKKQGVFQFTSYYVSIYFPI